MFGGPAGDTGDTGDTGGNSGTSALRTMAAGVDTTPSVVSSGGGQQSVVVPLSNPVLSQLAYRPDYPLFVGGEFPDRSWDPALKAELVMAEFGASGWTAIEIPDPDLTERALAAEIDELLSKAYTFRNARMAEIVAQADNLKIYWSDILNISAASYTATWQLVCIGLAVGHMVGMYFKAQKHRARPVQVYPTLMPGIITPSHPSYPNNHALQSHLVALCVMAATSAGEHHEPELSPYRDALVSLADRIGENREIVGVHFPSDAKASRYLAPLVWKYLRKGSVFETVVGQAALEWQPAVRSVPHRYQYSPNI